MGQLCGDRDRAQVLGRPPQCCPNEATLMPSWQGHLCKTSHTALVLRLFQGCPGATIPVKSSQGSPSATIPVRPSQGCAAATILARPSQCHCFNKTLCAVPVKPVPGDHAGAIPVRTLPVMPAAVPFQQGHPGAITTRPSWSHHNKGDPDPPYSEAIPVSPFQQGQSVLSW